MSLYFENEVKELEKCLECVDGICQQKFPLISDFRDNGIFSHIRLPLSENEDVPDEVLKYIYGCHYDDGGGVKRRHYYNIKDSLNNLHLSPLPIIQFPKLEDFMEGGLFHHIKLPIKRSESIPKELLKYIYGDGYENWRQIKPDDNHTIRSCFDDFAYALC